MASVNQTRPHCVNQMGKTHSKYLAARHGRGTAWARHGHSILLCRALLVDKLSFIYCLYIFISLFTFPFIVGSIIYVINIVCIEHC